MVGAGGRGVLRPTYPDLLRYRRTLRAMPFVDVRDRLEEAVVGGLIDDCDLTDGAPRLDAAAVDRLRRLAEEPALAGR